MLAGRLTQLIEPGKPEPYASGSLAAGKRDRYSSKTIYERYTTSVLLSKLRLFSLSRKKVMNTCRLSFLHHEVCDTQQNNKDRHKHSKKLLHRT
jgi:hypothetical protein